MAISKKSVNVEIEKNDEIITDYFQDKGWGDGLPIIPPTVDRVNKMISAVNKGSQEVLGELPPRWGKVTIEKLAINSVMAGCKPEYFPVVVAAVEAMLDPKFQLHLTQTTTHPVAPLVVVNGPIVKKISINGGANCFGPGWQANATIGRAIRLILLNIGGAYPGKFDRATQGQPSKYTFCIAENEDANPWDSLHKELGYSQDESVVTVIPLESPHNVNDHVSKTAHNLLTTISDAMSSMAANNMYINEGNVALFLSPEHATTVANDGLSKKDVKRFLYENARVPVYKAKLGGMWEMRDWPKWFNTVDDHALLPIVREPDDIIIIVAGGIGKHSSYSPCVGVGRSVSQVISQN
jgi:hypothetical protein